MTMPLFRRVQPLVTVYSRSGDIDGRTAPPELLAALKKDANIGQAKQSLSHRAGSSQNGDEEPESGPAYVVSCPGIGTERKIWQRQNLRDCGRLGLEFALSAPVGPPDAGAEQVIAQRNAR